MIESDTAFQQLLDRIKNSLLSASAWEHRVPQIRVLEVPAPGICCSVARIEVKNRIALLDRPGEFHVLVNRISKACQGGFWDDAFKEQIALFPILGNLRRG